ncbi:MAG: formate/nitrite transporter family protein [Clostridiales bacterium]|nr:formate/nitrite transporter family protein [Clostridiales bacterium]
MPKGGFYLFAEDVAAASKLARNKVSFLEKNPKGYFLASMLAGIFVGFGVILISTIGGLLGDAPHTKILMGASFGVGLSLVIMAGSELFTGNNLVMSLGILNKAVTTSQALKLWLVCWFGNWAGSFLLALIYWASGFTAGATGTFIANTAAAKMSLPFLQLLVRGVLCNILVCLAVWCSIRCKSESGKLIMVFWCIFAFVTSGFEHSIANMTLLSIALLSPMGAAVSLGGYFYNILVVTLGNMLGAILFLALPYHMISKQQIGK